MERFFAPCDRYDDLHRQFWGYDVDRDEEAEPELVYEMELIADIARTFSLLDSAFGTGVIFYNEGDVCGCQNRLLSPVVLHAGMILDAAVSHSNHLILRGKA
jgi:hypothetical protein